MIRTLILLFCSFSIAVSQPAKSFMVARIPVAHKATLTKALAEIGFQAEGGYTSFGIVIQGVEPEVMVYLAEKTDFISALQSIVMQAPGYTYEVVSDHLVDVYPQSVLSDATYPLNVTVSRIRITDTSALNVFSNPSNFIPELKDFQQREIKDHTAKTCGGLGPGLGSGSSKVDVTLQRVTVKQVLDAVAIASASPHTLASKEKETWFPVGWVLNSQINSKTGERTDKWSFMVTVPHGWHHELPIVPPSGTSIPEARSKK